VPEEVDVAVVRRFVEEIINEGKLELWDELLHSSHVNHDPTAPEVGEGPAGLRELIGMYRAALPDLYFEIGEVFAVDGGSPTAGPLPAHTRGRCWMLRRPARGSR
jgi:hypothetical protein